MSYILGFFSYIQGLGATVMMPIIICILGCIMGASFGKSLRAGLTVGVGFVGLNLVIGLMGSSLGAAVGAMSTRFGLSLSIIDVGWPSAAAIAFATQVGTFIIPVCLLTNIVLLFLRATQTVDVDIWNYWHFAFTGSLVAILTKSVGIGILAAIVNEVIVLVIGDVTGPDMEKVLDMPGVSIPHGYSGAFVPIAFVVNFVIDHIPGLKDVDVNLESIQKKFGVLGEPIIVGTIIGIILGLIAGDTVAQTLQLGVTLGGVLVLIPKMASLLMEGLMPVSEAAGGFIQKHMKGFGKMYIGLDSAVGVGNPLTLAIGLILVPLAILFAVILPGNHVLPFTDLAVLPYITVMVIPVCKGNGFRSLITGIICLIATLYIATDLSPLITVAAKQASFDMGTATAISSMCDGGNPLTWLLVRLYNLGNVAGMGIGIALAVFLIIWNKKRIAKIAKEVESETAAQ